MHKLYNQSIKIKSVTNDKMIWKPKKTVPHQFLGNSCLHESCEEIIDDGRL